MSDYDLPSLRTVSPTAPTAGLRVPSHGVNELAELVVDLLATTRLLPDDKLALAGFEKMKGAARTERQRLDYLQFTTLQALRRRSPKEIAWPIGFSPRPSLDPPGLSGPLLMSARRTSPGPRPVVATARGRARRQRLDPDPDAPRRAPGSRWRPGHDRLAGPYHRELRPGLGHLAGAPTLGVQRPPLARYCTLVP